MEKRTFILTEKEIKEMRDIARRDDHYLHLVGSDIRSLISDLLMAREILGLLLPLVGEEEPLGKEFAEVLSQVEYIKT